MKKRVSGCITAVIVAVIVPSVLLAQQLRLKAMA